MYKKALNPIKERGFDSKAQMRYLLMLMREYPDKYGWVKDVLANHGVPSTDGPLHTYWEGPYNVSPATPSYTYTGRGKRDAALKGLNKFANKLSKAGFDKFAQQVEDAMPKLLVKPDIKEVANIFWTHFGNEMKLAKTQEELAEYFDSKLQKFLDDKFEILSPSERTEVRALIGDKMLGREV